MPHVDKEYWTMGGQLSVLRDAVQHMADDALTQVCYLKARHIDGDELWNELGDASNCSGSAWSLRGCCEAISVVVPAG